MACGGLQNIEDLEERKAFDEEVRRRRGCDKPPKMPHRLRCGADEVVLNECPSKALQEVAEAFEVHAWAERGRLQYLYPPEELPVILGEALNIIETELMKREHWAYEKASRRKE
jgi:hypothetical protein